MRLKKALSLWVMPLLIACGMTACDEEDEKGTPPVGNPWLEGTINDEKICISEDATYNGMMGIHQMSPLIWWISLDRELANTNYVLRFNLGELQENLSSNHRISQGKFGELQESCSITRRKKEGDVKYYPLKNPCMIQVENFIIDKELSGKINGIFYNTKNLQDSLILNTQFKVRL